MRLGEILISDGLVLPAHVDRALAGQRRRPGRLGSLLVEAGLATADAIARALGRQHGVPAALERHLLGRDPALAIPIAADFARGRMVLPLARSRDGGVVVAMRDPTDAATIAELSALLGAPVVAAVACELILRRQVDRAYQPADEIEINLETGLIPTILEEPAEPEHELELGDVELGPPTDILDPATVRAEPTAVRVDFLDPDTIRIGELVSLDDIGVTRDARQTDPGTMSGRKGGAATGLGAIKPAMATPPQTRPPVGQKPGAPGAVTPVTTDEPVELTTTLTRIATAITRAAVAAAVVEYGRTELDGLLVFAVRQGMAFGDAGFAPDQTPAAIEAVTLPLNLPSVLRTAVETVRTYAGRPPVGSGIQDRLLKLLGRPAGIVVVPISTSGRVVSVIVAACSSADRAEAMTDALVTVADACGAAYGRLRS